MIISTLLFAFLLMLSKQSQPQIKFQMPIQTNIALRSQHHGR